VNGRLRARELLRDLRLGHFDVLVGVNLLREGLDLPEVSLVAILDADKEGFLRSETSLMQTIGRSARNVNAKVLLYADKVTDSMQRAIEETIRRRRVQEPIIAKTTLRRNHPEGHPPGHRSRCGRPRPGQRGRRPDRRGPVQHRGVPGRAAARCWRPPRPWSSSGGGPCADRMQQMRGQLASRWPRRRWSIATRNRAVRRNQGRARK